ncbi:MAG: FecR domain-containing protein [Deltaproteobacteria bacterium]|nr:FecR domain-containing protein [Deltaproteobacteria bacterium]
MSERDEGDRLERALERVRRDADDGPLPRGGFADMERRRRRRRLDTALGAVAATAVLAGLAGLGWWRWSDAGASDGSTAGWTASGPGPAASTAGRTPAGGTVTYVAERDARVRELGARVFAVDAGTVWFSVEPGSGRMEVRTPDRTVVVVGTVFAVSVATTGGAGATTVGVLNGHVRVQPRRGAAVELLAGQQLAPESVAVAPLQGAWRERMTSLFPERVARESGPPALDAVVTSTAGPAPAASSDGVAPGVPSERGSLASAAAGTTSSDGVAGAPTGATTPQGVVVPGAPPGAPVPGGAGDPGAAASPPETPTPRAPEAATMIPRPPGTAVATPPAATPATAARETPAAASARPDTEPGGAAQDRDAESPTLPIPPPASWDDRYCMAEALLATDPARAAAELEELVVTAPSRGREERVLLELANIYSGTLRDPSRTRDAYERYLERFPHGAARPDVLYNLCQLLGAQGDGAMQRRCLEKYLAEFPNGPAAEAVRRQLGRP